MRIALLLFVVLPYAAMAETAYITDNLRLGLHRAADTGDRAFRTLESGQELEIISRDRYSPMCTCWARWQTVSSMATSC